jgi:hypothetical protein
MPSWLVPILATAVLGGGIFLLRRHLSRFERSLATVERKLVCPARGELVEVEALLERRTGYFTEIRSCRAPGGSAQAGCSQVCVQALNARTVSRLAAHPSEG